MQLDSQIYLNCAKYLSECMPCPVALFSPQGQPLACTHPIRAPFAQMVVRQCLDDPARSGQIAGSYGAQYAVLKGEDQQPLCILLFMEAAGQDGLLAPVRTLLLLLLQEHNLHAQLFFESDEHLSFVREILFSNAYQNVALREQAIRRQYPVSANRVVMLFDPLDDSLQELGERRETPLVSRKDLFSKTIAMAPGYHFDDIFDLLNLKRIVLLKMIPPEMSDFPEEYLYTFAQAVLAMMQRMDGGQFRVSIGSCYNELAEIRNSYEEACFIANHFDFFDTEDRGILFVTDHIADYLFSLLPDSYFAEKFAPLTPLTGSRSNLPQTLCALSRYNMNFQETARAMCLHRNTLLQRYSKMDTLTKLDPAKNRQDRVTARQYALFHRRRTIIRAGSIIRGKSILTQLYDWLAECISRNSDGAIQLEVQTVGLSGNNALLLEMLRQDKIDFCVGQAGMLLPLLGDAISIVDVPFLFPSPHQAIQILNGPVGQQLLAPLQDSGFYGLAFWSMGWRYFTSRSELPIRQPQDLNGRSVRIMRKPLLDAFIRYLGAEPCYISYDKLTDAVDSALVDVQENPYQNFYDMRLYESHRNLLELNMLFDSNVLLTSSRFWNRFSVSEQQTLSRSIQQTVTWNSSSFYHITAAAKPAILEKGVGIHIPSQKESLPWRRAAKEFILSSSYRQLYLDFLRKTEEGGELLDGSFDV